VFLSPYKNAALARGGARDKGNLWDDALSLAALQKTSLGNEHGLVDPKWWNSTSIKPSNGINWKPPPKKSVITILESD
jgi:hypothetical protein